MPPLDARVATTPASACGRLYATPLFIVLLVVETSDILITVDSSPAVLPITLNAFIVCTSNVFAILVCDQCILRSQECYKDFIIFTMNSPLCWFSSV